MEESQNPRAEQTQDNFQSNKVSFPTLEQPQKNETKKMLLVFSILVLVAILGFVIYKSAANKNEDDDSTVQVYDNLTTPSAYEPVPTQLVIPSSTPFLKIDKTKIRIQVQNGTGVTGDAAYLKTQLENLGFNDVKTGNSESVVTATSVTFLKSLDESVVNEITQKLNLLYQTVNIQTSSSLTFDVVVVTGTKKGSTPKPGTGTSLPAVSASPSATPKTTPKATL